MIHGQTASEVIYTRADVEKEHMGLTTWKDAPHEKNQKFDVPMTMLDWETRLNRFIQATDRNVLMDAGKVTTEIAKAHAESEFEKYRIIQDRLFQSDFDKLIDGIRNE